MKPFLFLKKILRQCSIVGALFFASSMPFVNHALNVNVPVAQGSNAQTVVTTSRQIQGQENGLIEFFQVINKYLWIILIVVSLAVLTYGGFMLMQGKKEANNIYLALVGVLVAIMAYAIVRLVANLF